MNKLIIEKSFLFNPMTGIGAYVLTLMNVLKSLKRDFCTEELILPPKTKFKFIYHFLWFNTLFFIKTICKKPDVVFCPSFIMPYLTCRNTKYITVIHDLCHLRKSEMSKYSSTIFDLSTKIAIKKATTIVTVSETIKQELIEKFNVNSSRIKVVYNSIGEHFFNSIEDNKILEKYSIKKDKYLLSVATLNKRKNIPELIKAFEKISDKYPDLKLVLVGGMGNEQREKLTQHKNIVFTGYIADEELPTLYQYAMLYVFSSLYEGFGIPLIEAQQMNCPVLCSDIPVFREIAKESAEFSTTEADGIAEKIEYLINNPKRREELIELGKENVKRFYINKITEQLKDIV